MVRGHVTKRRVNMRIFLNDLLNFLLILARRLLFNKRQYFSLMTRDQSVKVHEVFSQGSSLIKTCMLNSTSRNNFIWRNAENIFIFQFLDGEYDSKRHAHR